MAIRLFDDRRGAKTPNRIAGQTRQPLKRQRGLYLITRIIPLPLNVRRAYLARNTHPASVVIKVICRPLPRGRKIELVICRIGRRADERFKTRAVPKPFAARESARGRQAQIAHLTGYEIAQRQIAQTWTRDQHIDAGHGVAMRIRM